MNNSAKKVKVMIITGPTATGKTDAAVDFAYRHGGEIVSADSMLVYRRMDIGTAKPTKEQIQKVPHHMVDVADPTEDFSAARWQQGAKEAIKGIHSRGNIPIVAGGTGLYIRSLLYPMGFAETVGDESIRTKWESFLAENGAQRLHGELAKIDPLSANRLPAGDTRRIIRALEIFECSGVTMSEKIALDSTREPEYDAISLGVNLPREVLYDRINRRVDGMIGAGLALEVQSLLETGVSRAATAMQGLGYKEIAAYLAGECSLDDAIDTLKRRTRNFAKRQVTWFKKYGDVIWLDAPRSGEDISAFFNEYYKKHL